MPSSPPPKRERAIAKPFAGTGNHRYTLYARAWQRVQAAEAAGFHLEAITLLESLIGDRMESRASFLTGNNEGFKTLGYLINKFRERETVPDFRKLVDRIDKWKEHRNRALHEMVKFESGTLPTWDEQTAGLGSVVREGQELLREFATLDEIERAKNGARPPATSPNAFSELPSSRISTAPSNDR